MNLRWIVLLAILLSSSGCRLLNRPDDCRRVDNSIAEATATPDVSQSVGHVRSCYDGIENLEALGDLSLDGVLIGQSLALELEECCCIAATNSPLADLIDYERKAACCSIGFNVCLDRLLAALALQVRNKAAGTAGELFLRLVEVHLQKDLVLQSMERLDEFREASRFAAEQGLATDQADKELDANEIDLKRKLLEIEKNQLQITVKLNALLGMDSGDLEIIQPIFDLHPVYEYADVENEIQIAFAQRADLNAFENRGCGIDPECFELLAQLSPGIGGGIVGQIKKAILLHRIADQQKCATGTRRKQINEMKSARRELIRAEVTGAIVDIEAGYRELVLENQDLERLLTRMQALEAAAEVKPMETFVESIKNWAEQQLVRSQRISAAVNFEVAKIKLITATGRWNEICGIPMPSDRNCDCSNK